MSGLLVLLIIVAVVILIAIWALYNGLITGRNRVDESWSDINVQLKRRYDLIPNLVSTVQGYAKHEKTVFEDVTEARAAAIGATGMEQKAAAENQLAGTLKSLFAVSEAYPDLKASQNFLDLQNQLTDTEDKIQASRRFYNGNVRDYNIKLQKFPSNLVAGPLGFSKREFFGVDNQAEIEKPVEVKF